MKTNEQISGDLSTFETARNHIFFPTSFLRNYSYFSAVILSKEIQDKRTAKLSKFLSLNKSSGGFLSRTSVFVNSRRASEKTLQIRTSFSIFGLKTAAISTTKCGYGCCPLKIFSVFSA